MNKKYVVRRIYWDEPMPNHRDGTTDYHEEVFPIASNSSSHGTVEQKVLDAYKYFFDMPNTVDVTISLVTTEDLTSEWISE